MSQNTNTSELIKKVRRIELKTRGLSKQIFSGEYHSAFKGRGMAFSEVRDYAPGDEIRDIDWNVTARFGHPFVKVFEEERELNVMLVVDISGSDQFGSHSKTKKEVITELCAVLAFSAIQNNDKIGVILFSDQIELFIPPKKGKKHILRIIRELIEFEPNSKQTDIAQALAFLNRVTKKRSICFLISDFISPAFDTELKMTNKKHDLIALNVFDQRERTLPKVGVIPFEDMETGAINWVNTNSRSVRENYAELVQKRHRELQDILTKSGVDHADIDTSEDYIIPLSKLLKKRA